MNFPRPLHVVLGIPSVVGGGSLLVNHGKNKNIECQHFTSYPDYLY
jgi:hypothetical protein